MLPYPRSVVQPVTHHANVAAGAPVVQGVERMCEHRVTAMRAGRLRTIRCRERQVVTAGAADDVEGAHPVQ